MIRIILSTFPQEESAVTTIHTLLAEQLIACGTILPGARSLYRWKDKIEDSQEVVVIFKTLVERYGEFEKRLRSLHPYDVPEMLAFDPISANKDYEKWVSESCKL